MTRGRSLQSSWPAPSHATRRRLAPRGAAASRTPFTARQRAAAAPPLGAPRRRRLHAGARASRPRPWASARHVNHGLRQPHQGLHGPAAGRPGTEVRGWPAAAGPQVPPGLPFTAELHDSSPLQLPQSELPSCLLPCMAGGLASAGASPAKDALQPDSPPALLTQLCSPAGSPSQLLQFGRLRIDSAPSSPQLSPRPPSQRASPEAKQRGVSSPAGTPPASQLVTSLWRWQQQQQQQQVAASPVPLLAPEDSGDEDWCIPASPGICSQQGAQPFPALIPVSPGLHSPLPQQHPVQAAGVQAAAAPPAGVPASPFRSSQERREEIAILSEMAEAGAAEWSSQEAEMPPPPAQQRQQHQHPRPPAAGSMVAAVVSQPGGGQPGGSQQGGVHLACSLTSQEASEVADPWSQPEDEAEEQRRRQQQAEEERQHWALETAAQAEQQQEQAQVRACGAGSATMVIFHWQVWRDSGARV